MSLYLLPHSVRFCKLICLSCILRHFFACKGVKDLSSCEYIFRFLLVHKHYMPCYVSRQQVLSFAVVQYQFPEFSSRTRPRFVCPLHTNSRVLICVSNWSSVRKKRSFLSLTSRTYSFSAYRSSVKSAMVW